MKKIIEGAITSPFGYRTHPVTGVRSSMHNGVDIGAPIGTPIYAPCDGEVIDTYQHRTGGVTMIIAAADGGTRYGLCHLSGYAHGASRGSKITRGQLVAHSGNTGLGTGAHLHFSVKTGGRWVGSEYVGGEFVDPVTHLEIK